ncbi:hypothetical protein DQ04_11891000 [Trypanosoma grayi]|uniref:hypothetical protein n=1 Tax=Trypanosoma grayi TaxID=71804 RepID=UPI0004F4417C|nr:hypothetical protein DQ04_11891000 [Trypanosoma grayi]KEG06859.1 hypothetical protein DQ04_11891000 [Trypanosoma grayi]
MPQNPRLRIRLIGPSGHKSEYHCATLLGNWQEERTSFGLKDPAKQPLENITTYKGSYKGPANDEELFAAKPPGCFCSEAPAELLFYQGDIKAPPKHQFTVHELSYTDPTSAAATMTLKDILDKEGTSQRREKTDALRRTMGLSAKTEPRQKRLSFGKSIAAAPSSYSVASTLKSEDGFMESTRSGAYKTPTIPPIGRVQEKERFLTTKNVTLDATGLYVTDNIDEYPATSTNCWGQFMAYKDNPMQRTRLREQYEE